MLLTHRRMHAQRAEGELSQGLHDAHTALEEASDAIERIRQWRLQRGLAVDFDNARGEHYAAAEAAGAVDGATGRDDREDAASPVVELQATKPALRQPEDAFETSQQLQQQADSRLQTLLQLMRG